MCPQFYMTFAENEGGAEGYAAAVTRDQARLLFLFVPICAKRDEFCVVFVR